MGPPSCWPLTELALRHFLAIFLPYIFQVLSNFPSKEAHGRDLVTWDIGALMLGDSATQRQWQLLQVAHLDEN